MAKSKVTSSRSGFGVSTGKTKMFGKMGVQSSQSGVSAPTNAPSFDKAVAKGGGANRSNKQGGSLPAEPGKVSVAKSGVGNTKGFSVPTGKGHMVGKQTASQARRA